MKKTCVKRSNKLGFAPPAGADEYDDAMAEGDLEYVEDIDDRGRKTVLARGEDFYRAPRVATDGDRIAWISWRHPNLPWDGTELWLADLDDAGAAIAPEYT